MPSAFALGEVGALICLFYLRWAAVHIHKNYDHRAIFVHNNQEFVITGIVISRLDCTTFYAFIEEQKLKCKDAMVTEHGEKSYKFKTARYTQLRLEQMAD